MNGSEVGAWIRERLERDVVGQSDVVERIIACVGARAHLLLEGPPGVAKTLVANEIAHALGLDFKRIQMTPDLMPGDLLGTSVWLPNEGRFEFRRGPVFTHVLLADEINRAPPKTQAALLQAMQEHRVTLDGVEHALGRDFWVVATQNPLDQEGTYPLPESQLDRFALKVSVPFPAAEDELEVLRRHQRLGDALERAHDEARESLPLDALHAFQAAVRAVHVADPVLRYIHDTVRLTREQSELVHGAGPRAALALLDVSRSLAVVRGRDFAVPDDVRDLYLSCVAHRVKLAPEAMVTGVTVEEVLERILRGVPVPEVRAS